MMTKFEELNDFISNKMRMSHIYQPVMLKTLLSQGGSAPITTIALSLLSKDQSQLDYYQHITKTMVGKVLTKNRGITERLGDEYHLKGFDELSQEQVDELIMLCEEKIDGYIEKRGKAIWSHPPNHPVTSQAQLGMRCLSMPSTDASYAVSQQK